MGGYIRLVINKPVDIFRLLVIELIIIFFICRKESVDIFRLLVKELIIIFCLFIKRVSSFI